VTLERSTSPDRCATSTEPMSSVRSWARVTGPLHRAP
jgi:hypothetical protein